MYKHYVLCTEYRRKNRNFNRFFWCWGRDIPGKPGRYHGCCCLVSCVAWSSSTMVLAVSLIRVMVFDAERFQLPRLSQYQEMIENSHTFVCVLKKFKTYRVNWLWPTDAIRSHRPGSRSFPIRVVVAGTESLPGSLLTYCQMKPKKQAAMEFKPITKTVSHDNSYILRDFNLRHYDGFPITRPTQNFRSHFAAILSSFVYWAIRCCCLLGILPSRGGHLCT